jgi:hypothetical protein
MLVQKDVPKRLLKIGCQRIRQLFIKINSNKKEITKALILRKDKMGTEKKKFNDHMIKETEKIPQHVLDDIRGDEIRERRKELAQMEMYDDPYMNWSGLR